MTDIVDRLNGLAHALRKDGKQMAGHEVKEAANEIERLREALRAALLAHDIVEAEHPSPNKPMWVEPAREALRETGHE